MLRNLLIATTAAVGLAGCAADPPARPATAAPAAGPPAAMQMQPNQRMQVGRMMGSRVRSVMFGENGGTVDLVYDEMDPRTRTMSQRAIRLENRNGMLEVVYDTTVPSMPTARATVRRVENNGNGMIEIVYAR